MGVGGLSRLVDLLGLRGKLRGRLLLEVLLHACRERDAEGPWAGDHGGLSLVHAQGLHCAVSESKTVMAECHSPGVAG